MRHASSARRTPISIGSWRRSIGCVGAAKECPLAAVAGSRRVRRDQRSNRRSEAKHARGRSSAIAENVNANAGHEQVLDRSRQRRRRCPGRTRFPF